MYLLDWQCGTYRTLWFWRLCFTFRCDFRSTYPNCLLVFCVSLLSLLLKKLQEPNGTSVETWRLEKICPIPSMRKSWHSPKFTQPHSYVMKQLQPKCFLWLKHLMEKLWDTSFCYNYLPLKGPKGCLNKMYMVILNFKIFKGVIKLILSDFLWGKVVPSLHNPSCQGPDSYPKRFFVW